MDDSYGHAQGGQLHAQISTHALRPSPGSYSKLSPRCFSGTLTRCSTFSTTTSDTKTMTHHHHPHPSRRPPPMLQAPTKSPSTPKIITSRSAGTLGLLTSPALTCATGLVLLDYMALLLNLWYPETTGRCLTTPLTCL